MNLSHVSVQLVLMGCALLVSGDVGPWLDGWGARYQQSCGWYALMYEPRYDKYANYSVLAGSPLRRYASAWHPSGRSGGRRPFAQGRSCGVPARLPVMN